MATPASLETVSRSADPKWHPEIPEEDRLDYDPDLANQILDDAGYLDSDGDGIREMPDGTNPIVIRHAVNTDGDVAGPIGDLMVGWMEEIGIGVDLEAYDQDALFGVIVDGTYDTFYWGWVPFVDPDPMLSYFTEAELGNFNDANWFDPAYDEMYAAQNQEVDPDARVEIVHDMLTLFHDAAIYIPDVPRPRPPGLPHRHLRGLGQAAGRDRAGHLQQHLAGLHRAHPDRSGCGRWLRHQLVALGWDRRRGDRHRRCLSGDAEPFHGRRAGVSI